MTAWLIVAPLIASLAVVTWWCLRAGDEGER